MRKLAIAALALLIPAAVLTAAPAQARDTSWGCPGCIVSHR